MRVGWMALVVLAGGAAWGGERGGRVERVEHRKSEMVRVPAGTFTMGYPAPAVEETEDDGRVEAFKECWAAVGAGGDFWCMPERAFPYPLSQEILYLYPYVNAIPERQVFLPSFEIDRHEVTIARYRRCVAAGACDSGPLIQGDQRQHVTAANPVTNVTWREAGKYCAFVGKRLPTEAEWEKAARGTDGRRWPWGEQDRADGGNHGKMESDAIRQTHAMERDRSNDFSALFEVVADASDGAEYAVPPGTMRWSESRYGAMDMAGNVAEWVVDYYGAAGYADLPEDSPVRRVPHETDTRRVVRGGSWLDLPLAGRTYSRSAARPGTRSPLVGFRCARDA